MATMFDLFNDIYELPEVMKPKNLRRKGRERLTTIRRPKQKPVQNYANEQKWHERPVNYYGQCLSSAWAWEIT